MIKTVRNDNVNKPDKVIVQAPPVPIDKTFSQQLLGPWTSNDPKIQRSIVRTRASSGITARRFQAVYPPAPTIFETKTPITGGFEFAINLVAGGTIAGYNVYSSTTNNGNVATLIRYVPQPVVTRANLTVKVQDITAANPFYWVASVNSSGKESTRVPVAGVPAPQPSPTKFIPSGGGSGNGSGGGRGKAAGLALARSAN
jgi:hypothetical protein